MICYQLLFFQLRAGLFPDVLVDCPDDLDGGVTPVQARAYQEPVLLLRHNWEQPFPTV